ncbi:hypothetical protein M5G07_03570 [Serratia symbiotica]|nr:hypothetical protein [Serratia symbiotica]
MRSKRYPQPENLSEFLKNTVEATTPVRPASYCTAFYLTVENDALGLRLIAWRMPLWNHC